MIKDQKSEIVLDNERGVKSQTWNYDAEPWMAFFHSTTSGSTGQKNENFLKVEMEQNFCLLGKKGNFFQWYFTVLSY